MVTKGKREIFGNNCHDSSRYVGTDALDNKERKLGWNYKKPGKLPSSLEVYLSA